MFPCFAFTDAARHTMNAASATIVDSMNSIEGSWVGEE
jgi:hypothetical protein